MNRTLAYIIIFFLGIGILLQAHTYYNKKNKEIFIPEITLISLDGQTNSLNKIAENHNVLVFIIHSTCDYCKLQIENVKENLAQFQNTHLVFISFEDLQVIESIKEESFIENQPFIDFFQASRADFAPYLEHELVFPYFIWYKTDGTQKIQHRGLFAIEGILEALAN